MSTDTKGVEFWQNCAPPATCCTIRFEEGIAYTIDRNGVEYRRAKNIPSQRERGAPYFVWQRKMWRMA